MEQTAKKTDQVYKNIFGEQKKIIQANEKWAKTPRKNKRKTSYHHPWNSDARVARLKKTLKIKKLYG